MADGPIYILEKAIDRLKEFSEKSNPGPWHVRRGGGIHIDGTSDYNSIVMGHQPAVAQVGYRGQSAEWIAMMSPDLAKPLISWLTDTKEDISKENRNYPITNSEENAINLANCVLKSIFYY